MSKRASSSTPENHGRFSDSVPSSKVFKFIEEKTRLVRDLRPHGKVYNWEQWSDRENYKEFYAVLPPLDSFMNVDKRHAEDHIWNGLDRGDLVIVRVASIRDRGLSTVLLAFDGGKSRDVEHHKIHGWCDVSEIPKKTNHEDVLLRFSSGDILRCLVLDVNARDSELILSMLKQSGSRMSVPLGKVDDDQLPLAYRRQLSTSDSFEEILVKSVSFVNPNNVEYLMSRLKIPSENIISLMKGLHNKFYLKEEYADYLRKKQSKKVADKSVKQGIEKFKRNEFIEALQDFNYALDMDTGNVDALVARGALYANRGSFSKAIHDFEGALKLEPEHRNAKKYLVEVLVERAKQIESQMDDVQQVKEVEKCYNRALRLNPNCEEARNALGKIEQDKEMKKAQQSSSSSDSGSNDEQYAATAEKLRKILKGESSTRKRTLSRSSSKSVKSNHESRRRSSKKSNTDSSSCSSSSNSSLPSSEDDKVKKKKRRRRSSSSSSSSESSSTDSSQEAEHEDRGRRHSNQEKTSSARAESPLDRRKHCSSPNQRRKSSSSSVSFHRKPTERRRHSDLAKTGCYQAIIHSRDSHNYRDLNAYSRSPKKRNAMHPSKVQPVKATSANISKVTKDNFNDILKEISKFESANKFSR